MRRDASSGALVPGTASYLISQMQKLPEMLSPEMPNYTVSISMLNLNCGIDAEILGA